LIYIKKTGLVATEKAKNMNAIPLPEGKRVQVREGEQEKDEPPRFFSIPSFQHPLEGCA